VFECYTLMWKSKGHLSGHTSTTQSVIQSKVGTKRYAHTLHQNVSKCYMSQQTRSSTVVVCTVTALLQIYSWVYVKHYTKHRPSLFIGRSESDDLHTGRDSFLCSTNRLNLVVV
jgi:hypothetical protein